MAVAEDEKSQRRNAHFIQFIAMFSGYITMLDFCALPLWTSVAIPHSTSDKSEIPVSMKQVLDLVFFIQIPGIFGCIVSSMLLNRIGRKYTLLLFSYMQLIPWILVNLAYDSTFLSVAKAVVEFGEGGSYTVLVIYIGEVSGKEMRGTFLSLAMIFMTFGTFLINEIRASLPYMELIMTLVPITAICLSAFTVETPYYHLMQNRDEEAIKTLVKLSGSRKREMVIEDIQRMKNAVIESRNSDNTSIRELFSDRGSRRALISLIVTEMTYILSFRIRNEAGQYDFARNIEFFMSKHASIIIIGVLIFIGILYSQFSDRWGRRFVFLFSGLMTAFALSSIKLFSFLQYDLKADVSQITWIPLVVFISYQLTSEIGLSIIRCVYSGELFPLKVKGAAVTCYWIAKMIIERSLEMMLPYVHIGVGIYSTLWILACLCVIGSIFVFCITPETKGKNLEEVVELMRGKRKRVHANDLLVAV